MYAYFLLKTVENAGFTLPFQKINDIKIDLGCCRKLSTISKIKRQFME